MLLRLFLSDMLQSLLARIMHRFSSTKRRADLSALRHAREGTRFRVGPRKRTVRYVEEAGGTRFAGRGHLLAGRAGGAARRMISAEQ